MSAAEAPETIFDESAQQAVDLGNRILDEDGGADTWEVASGLLAGAIQFWLFSRSASSSIPPSVSINRDFRISCFSSCSPRLFMTSK